MSDLAPARPSRRRLAPAVVAFGLVSLFTDASSELIYPLLPIFLVSVLGAGTEVVGSIEGVAESTAALFKLISGAIADRVRRRKPLTVWGYGLSSIARPLVAVAAAPWQVLAIRFADRVGKGVRGSPRDAILADVTSPEQRGRAFGFHRALDNAGAMVGPGLGLLLLYALHLGLRTIFALAAVPAVIAMLVLVFAVHEPAEHEPKPSRDTLWQRVREAVGGLALTPRLSRYFVALALFTLANSSDAFLILLARRHGVRTVLIPLLWMELNAVRALGSTWGGQLSDRMGRRWVILAGWLLYAAVYAGFAYVNVEWKIWALVAGYGIYYSLAEGTERALVADLAPKDARGRAFGGYNFVIGMLAFPASFLFGLVWDHWGPHVAFLAAAALAFGASGVLLLLVKEPAGQTAPK